MNERAEANRVAWNAVTPIHAASAFYDVEGFKQGRCTVFDVERREVGEVASKSLLHLQCHFGLDTLSWARLGARVVGMDISDAGIAQARALAEELQIPARFVCCDLYRIRQELDEQFDVVFTSAGALCWLHDLWEWGRIVAHFLKPGGVFYIHEFHPAWIFFGNPVDGEKRENYFHKDTPAQLSGTGTYTDPRADVYTETFEWSYAISDVINALIAAGLRIEFLHEFPHSEFQSHSLLVKGVDGLWRWPDPTCDWPLMFSIRAVKM
jgi:SAM-dependent methyltransferase